jgi:hypothetical protein
MTTLKALIKAMRPRQWTKNVVLYAALVFDQQLTVREYTCYPADNRRVLDFLPVVGGGLYH